MRKLELAASAGGESSLGGKQNLLFHLIIDSINNIIASMDGTILSIASMTLIDEIDYIMRDLGPIGKAVDLIVDSNKEDSSDGNDTTGSGEESSNGNIIEAVFAWEHLPSLVNLQAQASVTNLSFFLLHPSKAKNSNITLRYQHAPLSETRGWDAISRSFLG